MTGLPRYDLIIFDLDGVITTEHIYWECARLTIWELVHLRLPVAPVYLPAVHDAAARESILPRPLVFTVKNRAINSNWDLTYLASCAVLAAAGTSVTEPVSSAEDLIAALRRERPAHIVPAEAMESLLQTAGDRCGSDLMAYAGRRAAEITGAPLELFAPEGPWWTYGHDRFQLWYQGLLMGMWGADPLPERPVLPVEAMQETLSQLRRSGYMLGVATGRLREEAAPPLRLFGLLDYFSAEHMATYSDVEQASQELERASLGKPHPFSIRRAIFPEAADADLVDGAVPDNPVKALVVGDSASDALAARAAGVPCVGMLSGVAGEAARQARAKALLAAGCLAVLENIRALPAWLQQG